MGTSEFTTNQNMKKIILLIGILLSATITFATTAGDSIFVFDTNNPIHNLRKENLRILDIGNSYTTDATHYLPEIAAAAGATAGYSLYKATRSVGSFKHWVDIYNESDNDKNYLKFVAGDEIDEVATGTGNAGDGSFFRNALQNGKWDLILIHQVSTHATDFTPWNGNTKAGYLKELIQIIRQTNPQATIGFYIVHSYWSGYSGNKEKSSLERWENIATAIKDLRLNYGIDFIIPYGTAVQNLRSTPLNDGYDFSTDGTHLADGLGDYVAACCYWQSVFAPRFGSILGNSFRLTTLDESKKGVFNITDETATVAQKAAVLATKNMYRITNIDSFDIYMLQPAEYVYHNSNIIGYNYNEPTGDIIIPEGVSGISRGVFNGCKEITNVHLPSSLRTLGNYAFYNCTDMKTITSMIPGENLFAIDPTAFSNVDKDNCQLYVPCGAIQAYKSTDGWNLFKNIVEVTTNITNVRSTDKETKIYDLQGRSIEKPKKGIYIVNGRKVVIR